METNQPHIDVEKTPKSSHVDTQVLHEHPSIAASKIFNHQNELGQLQLPVSAQPFSIANIIQSNSFLTHLNDQNDTVSLKESPSSDNSISYGQKHASIDSDDQTKVA